MGALGWLSRHAADVPPDDCWLGAAERRVLAGLHVERRRADWRLGRFTAKAAVGAWLSVPPARIQILAAADGAPEAWLEDIPAPVSVSLSHRAARSVAAVGDAPAVVGCDLELIEPRSDPFVREWLAPAEQQLVLGRPAAERPLLVNLIWSAKEAAAKVRREGLRLNVRHALVSLGDEDRDQQPGRWRPLQVEWQDEGLATSGWWCVQQRWVIAVAGEPAPQSPRALSIDYGSQHAGRRLSMEVRDPDCRADSGGDRCS